MNKQNKNKSALSKHSNVTKYEMKLIKQIYDDNQAGLDALKYL